MSFNLLIVPGYHGSGDAHWQTWLERQIPGAKRVTGINWEKPVIYDWANAITHHLNQNSSKTVIVAHSFGSLATAVAAAGSPDRVAGIILAAPADPQRFGILGARENNRINNPSIAELLPKGSLKVPGLLIGSHNDSWMKFSHAFAWSKRWQLAFYDAGRAGHINADSGYGPWPAVKFFTESFHSPVLKKSEPAAVSMLLAASQSMPPSCLPMHMSHR